MTDHQPALCARLRVLSAQRLPQTHLHLDSTSCGLAAVHHLKRGSESAVSSPLIQPNSLKCCVCVCPLTSTISLISLRVSSSSSFTTAVPMGVSLRRKPLGAHAKRQPSGNLGLPLWGSATLLRNSVRTLESRRRSHGARHSPLVQQPQLEASR